jgi:serine/threonine protein kinase
VLDFGISKLTAPGEVSHAMTSTSALMGSPLYMSPEQMLASKGVDVRTDIWALGVILYELLAGRPPFIAELSSTRSATSRAWRRPTSRPRACARSTPGKSCGRETSCEWDDVTWYSRDPCALGGVCSRFLQSPGSRFSLARAGRAERPGAAPRRARVPATRLRRSPKSTSAIRSGTTPRAARCFRRTSHVPRNRRSARPPAPSTTPPRRQPSRRTVPPRSRATTLAARLRPVARWARRAARAPLRAWADAATRARSCASASFSPARHRASGAALLLLPASRVARPGNLAALATAIKAAASVKAAMPVKEATLECALPLEIHALRSAESRASASSRRREVFASSAGSPRVPAAKAGSARTR